MSTDEPMRKAAGDLRDSRRYGRHPRRGYTVRGMRYGSAVSRKVSPEMRL